MAHNRRNITYKLILSFMIICLSISPVFASTPEIEIEHNDNEYFHAYNSNTNVPNSYIDSGAAVFSKAMNYMFMNIAKSTSSVYSIQGIANNLYTRLGDTNTYLSNIATDIGLIKQGNTAQTNLLSSISSNSNYLVTYTSQIATALGGSTSGNLVDIKESISKLDWVNTNIVSTVSVSTQFNQSNPIYPNTGNTLSPGTYYLKLPNFPYDTSNFDTNLFRFDIPFRTQWTSLFNKNWITDVSVLVDNSNTVYQGDYYWDIDVMKNGQYYLRFYFLDFIPYHNNTLVIKFTTTDNWLFTSDDTKYVWYIPSSSPDYLAFNDYVNLKRLQAKDFTADVSGEVTIDTSEIIDAINNLSLTDNNVKVNVNYTVNDAQGVENIIPFIRNFFDNNISVSDFITEASEGENDWFSQANKDLMDNLSGGYVDLYD